METRYLVGDLIARLSFWVPSKPTGQYDDITDSSVERRDVLPLDLNCRDEHRLEMPSRFFPVQNFVTNIHVDDMSSESNNREVATLNKDGNNIRKDSSHSVWFRPSL